MSPLDLAALGDRIDRTDEIVRRAARARLDTLGLPVGGFGRVGDLAVWLAGVQGREVPRPLAAARLLVLAADHGVAERGVSAWPSGATGRLAARITAGAAPVSVAARLADLSVRVHDVGQDHPGEPDPPPHRVRQSTGLIDVEDALSRDEAGRAVATGVALVDAEVDAGADLLVLTDVGVGATTAAAALVGLLTRTDASGVVGRASGIDDATWMRKCAAVRDAMRRARPVLGDQVALLATAGGADLAVATGVLLQAAARRTPVLLDGLVSTTAALVGQRVSFRATDWWVAAHRTSEPAHELALDRLALDPVLDLGVDVGEGLGAALAVPLLRAASRLLAETEPWGDPGAGGQSG